LCVATLALAEPPPPDHDGDGITDIDDNCPTDPGTKANGGCPGAPPQRAEPEPKITPLASVRGTTIVLLRPIEFRSGSARLKPGNDDLLSAIAETILGLPDAVHVIVRGHTDDRGSRLANLRLSKKRAASVAQALAKAGVPKHRLRADGVGPDAPVTSNATADGRAQNRRVELLIVDATP